MPLLRKHPRFLGAAARALRAALSAAASLLLVTCTDNPTAPARSSVVQIRVYPTFDADARLAPLSVDLARVVIVRPPADTLKDISQSFPANQSQIQVPASNIPLISVSEDLEVTIELYSGSIKLFSGTQTLTVTAGSNPPPSPIPVNYAGPGSNIDSLALAPRDTVVPLNAAFQYSVSAFQAGSPQAQFYVTWSTTGGTIDPAGNFTAPGTPGVFMIRAVSPQTASHPNGVRDSTQVIVAVAGPGTTWTGAVNTDWNTANNWIPAQVPGASDNVTIPVTTNQPLVTTTANMADLTIAGGATVTLNGTFTFNVAGNLTATGNLLVSGGTPTVQLTGTGKTLAGQVANATITGTIALAGATTVSGNVAVSGGTATLDIGITALNVSGNFSTGSGGRLIMTTAGGQLNILGSATFGGGDETGSLTAGAISIGGNFTQTGGGSVTSFAASGTHVTGFTGAAATHTVTFGTPGTGAAGSHFMGLDIGTTGTVTLATDAFAAGLFTSAPAGAPPTLGANGTSHKLTAQSVSVTGLVVNQATLTIGGGTIVAFNSVQFTNMPDTVAQLTVNNPGAATPFNFTSLTFATTPVAPNGFYMDVIDSDGGASGSLVINMVAATPATPGGFVRATGGATVNWPPTTPILTWDGSASNLWSDPNNWTPAQVPSSTDDVLIPSGTPNNPIFNTSCSAKSLTVNNGATFNLGTGNCAVSGNVFADGAITGTGAITIATPALIRGNFPSLILSGKVTQSATVTATGNVTVTGTAGSYIIGGQSLTMGGNLNVQGGARLVMLSPSDLVNVLGNAVFSGGFELDSLDAGVLSIGGNLTQNTGSTGDTYHTSGTHQTIFTGNNPTIFFATPGDVPGTSHFQQFTWAGTGTLTLTSDVYAHVSLTTTSTTPVTISGGGHQLQVGNYTGAGPITFSNTRLSLFDPTGGPLTLNNATFSGLANTVIQLAVNHPGTGGPFTFNNLTFSVTPTGTGRYISATDADGPSPIPLTLNITNSSPATGPAPLITLVNGAVVNWPPTAPGLNWIGTTDGNWSTAANWNPAQVPTSANDVTISSGTPNAPTLNVNGAVKSLTVNTGATLTLGNFNLQTSGNVNAATGGIVGGGSGILQMVGPGTITGSVPALTITAAVSAVGSVTITGDLTIGTGGNYTAGGQATAITGNLITQSTGILTMSNPQDAIVVLNSVSFGGGATVATAGALQVHGGFTQTSTNGFIAGGNHIVQLVSSGPAEQISFANPGTNRFENLDVTSAGTVTIATNVTVAGQLVSTPVQVNPVLQSLTPGKTFTAGGATVTGLVMDGVPLILSGGPIASFSGVRFDNQSPVGTALTVNNTGAGGPFNFDLLTFTTQLTAGGLHLLANDLDGASANGALTINVSNSSPASGAGVSQVSNGAVIVWPFTPAPIWNGSQNNGIWNDPLNWTPNAVPGAADSVVIPVVSFLPSLQADVTVGAVNISGGDIGISGHVLTVARTLATTGIGTLTMHAGDQVLVGGNAVFAGTAGGVMDGGILQIGGNFSQLSTNNPASFAADSSHTTQFTSANPVISMQTPGPAASHFGRLIFNLGGHFTMITDIDASGDLQGTDGFGGTVNGSCGSVLTVRTMSNATLDCIRLVIDDPAGIGSFLGGITFKNQTSDVDQLTIRHPGLTTGSYTLSGVNFAAIASGTGHYVNAIDTDGSTPNALVVDVQSVNPGNGPAFTTQSNSATVTWGAAGGNIWLGTTDATWNNGTNWSSGSAPVATDNVAIPASAATQPIIAAPAVANNLTVDGGANLTINNALLTVSGSLSADGAITDVGSGAINLTGLFQPLSGNVGFISLQAGSSYSLSGLTIATTVQITGGGLGLNNNTMIVTGDFSTSGTGIFAMFNPGDQLQILGNATFAGGSTSGQLTDGVISVGGNFAETTAGAFSASGNHSVVLAGATQQNVSVPNGQFANLDANSPGGMLAQSDLFLTGALATTTGPINLNGHRVIVGGSFQTSGTGTLVMQNPNGFDSLFVTGTVSFAGGSTAGLLTNGVIRAGTGFQQLSAFSPQSFAPSGLHRTELGTGLAVQFQSPGSGAAGSHFNTLDVTAASAGVTFLSDAFVDSVLIASVGAAAPKIFGSGNVLTAKQWQIQGLQVDHMQMALNEGGVIRTQTFNGVSFSGFPTGPTSETLITVSAAGASLAPRQLQFNTTTLQMNFGNSAGTYVRVSSSNGQGLNLIMAGSNDPTGGFSRSVATPPATIQYQ